MDVLDFTPDAPRESLGRRVINYSPTICLAIFLVVYPFAGGYLWTKLCVSYLGIWGWTPTAVVVSATFVAICAFGLSVPRSNQSTHLSPHPTDFLERLLRYGCRTILVIAHMLSLSISLQCLFMIPVVIQYSEPWLTIIAMIVPFCGTVFMLNLFYGWYWRCRYEHAILAENADMYGNPVYVSIPIFKFCGHFVLLINGHKYELRLDAGCRRPLFSDRPLLPLEEEKITGTVRNYIVLVGWTRKETQDIRAIFQRLVNRLGAYHRINNNCRHFLQFGCMELLDVIARWDENMLLVGTDNWLLIPKTMVMMWRAMSRELFRFIWTTLWGPGWELHEPVAPRRYFADLGDRDINLFADD